MKAHDIYKQITHYDVYNSIHKRRIPFNTAIKDELHRAVFKRYCKDLYAEEIQKRRIT